MTIFTSCDLKLGKFVDETITILCFLGKLVKVFKVYKSTIEHSHKLNYPQIRHTSELNTPSRLKLNDPNCFSHKFTLKSRIKLVCNLVFKLVKKLNHVP